jgi:hypothetical protein
MKAAIAGAHESMKNITMVDGKIEIKPEEFGTGKNYILPLLVEIGVGLNL